MNNITKIIIKKLISKIIHHQVNGEVEKILVNHLIVLRDQIEILLKKVKEHDATVAETADKVASELGVITDLAKKGGK